MSLNFYRRVAFGLSPSDELPKDPLSWALNQLNYVPDFLWKGSMPTEKELRRKYGEWVYGDREVLRKKFKSDKNAYRKAKDELRIETGERYFELKDQKDLVKDHLSDGAKKVRPLAQEFIEEIRSKIGIS